ncbi:uncharacterized protein [Drosophila pseudoobscura]|uniref:F-box domain-containing protein n=1 Tax=Drosophila pseudoobscura pseudoobscura TaxID=46245 RepID=A0A6I8UCP5_DROPS|nr:uncharacterized protein LOC4813144 [Drosophila pseudoobscura]
MWHALPPAPLSSESRLSEESSTSMRLRSSRQTVRVFGTAESHQAVKGVNDCPTLTELNDDCLLLICERLSIDDQWSLLQLDERLGQLVLRIWCRKYAQHFDCGREQLLKRLSAKEQSQLLHLLCSRTRALLNLNGSSGGCRQWLNRKRKCLAHMQRMSFVESGAWVLHRLPAICPNLVHLQLGLGEGITPVDLHLLFGQLKHLRVLELQPGWSCPRPWTDIKYGETLESLKLPACLVRATATEIMRLPRLRRLTGFLCHKHTDDDKANAVGSDAAGATISACLKALQDSRGPGNGHGHGHEPPACQIVGLHLQCQLDSSLLRLMVETGSGDTFRLHRFAWHSQLTVHYDVSDGSIKWLPQQPRAAHALLPFLADQADSLRELDFTRNVHATTTFLSLLREQQKQQQQRLGYGYREFSVWHDACPRMTATTPHSDPDRDTDADTDTDAEQTNDLAFVTLELQHLSNEQRIRARER